MTDHSETNLVVSIVAKGAMAQLREIVPKTNRQTGESLYREILRLAHELRVKHGFRSTKPHENSPR